MSADSMFASTRWTLVLAAGRAGGVSEQETRSGRVALEELCATYRPPVLAHALRRGLSAADAEDAAADAAAENEGEE